jgi:hypothetical protein
MTRFPDPATAPPCDECRAPAATDVQRGAQWVLLCARCASQAARAQLGVFGRLSRGVVGDIRTMRQALR